MKDDFHIPFLHGMIVIAIVTVVSMVFAHHFISDKYFPTSGYEYVTEIKPSNMSE